ncbi:MAG: DUF2924 domain-containing protein [Magnetococcales bacterium]|nr:DUF2924 domain-containing protein [Magnetococcales bacterium]
MTISVLRQVTAIQEMNGTDLRKMWKEQFGEDPPSNNRTFLMKRLAYRVQDLALGGLSATLEERLEAIITGKPDPGKSVNPERNRENPLPGTRLIREWKGEEHCCTVLEDGFEYQGRKFKSLTAIANLITGTKWNGPLFWGVRRPGGQK